MTRSSLDFEEAQPASFEELRVRDCSIKRTLDVVGEKWTLLVIREALYGARRFEQFLANVGCARTLLSERLATLVEHGVLQREPYREPGQRERHQYLLTEKGHDLFAAVTALMHWGDRWEAGPQGRPRRGPPPRLRRAGARGAALRQRPSRVRGRGNRIRAQARPDRSIEQSD